MTRRITVADGLQLDDEMYETAIAALNEHARDVARGLTWERFTRRDNWVLVPDVVRPDEPFHKAEMLLVHGEPWTRTVKINVWRAPDLRKDGRAMPHSHPWPFDAHVLIGGYQEDRYELDHGQVAMTGCEHQAGDINEIPLTTFHEVTNVLVPGRTLTLMMCGQSAGKDNWGYLDPDTGQYTRYTPDPRLKQLRRDRNPHLR